MPAVRKGEEVIILVSYYAAIDEYLVRFEVNENQVENIVNEVLKELSS